MYSSDAGPAGWVRCWQVHNAESPKQASKRFIFITKRIHFSHHKYIVDLCVVPCLIFKRAFVRFYKADSLQGILSHWSRGFQADHRRSWIKTEEKAKVVTSVWGEEFIQFLAAQAVLHRTILNNRMNCPRMI